MKAFALIGRGGIVGRSGGEYGDLVPPPDPGAPSAENTPSLHISYLLRCRRSPATRLARAIVPRAL